MTYYERLLNKHDRHIYDSDEDRMEYFKKLSERERYLEEKSCYESEIKRGK